MKTKAEVCVVKSKLAPVAGSHIVWLDTTSSTKTYVVKMLLLIEKCVLIIIIARRKFNLSRIPNFLDFEIRIMLTTLYYNSDTEMHSHAHDDQN